MLAAVAHQVPHDQKISCQLEFFDERQFFLDLAARFGLHVARRASVARAKSFPRALAQKRIHGLAFGDGIARKFVAQIVEREFQASGKFARVGDGFGIVGEKLLHLLRRSQEAFGIARKQASSGRQRAMVADGGEGIAKLPPLRNGVADAVGGQQRKIQRTRNVDRSAIAGLFFALKMPLQFNVDIFRAENSDELIDAAPCFVHAALLQSRSQRPLRPAGKAD